MKNLHGEIFKLFQKLQENIFYENISKFQVYFSETFFLYLSFYVKLSNIHLANESHICLKEHERKNNFEKSNNTSVKTHWRLAHWYEIYFNIFTESKTSNPHIFTT